MWAKASKFLGHFTIAKMAGTLPGQSRVEVYGAFYTTIIE